MSDTLDKSINTIGEGIFNKLYSLNKKRQEYPLDYEETDYFKHREQSNHKEDYTRIGDCELSIPPEYIQVNSISQSENISSIRQKNSVKQGGSKFKNQIMIQFVISGKDQINGYPVEGPNGNTYYMDGLRSLLSHFSKAPFLPVTNYVLNVTHGIFNVALSNISVTSIEGYADSFMVQLKMYEMMIGPYTQLPEVDYDAMFNWELFRWYYQKNLFKNEMNEIYFKPMDINLQSIFNIGLLKQQFISKFEDDENDYSNIHNADNYNSIVNNSSQSFVVKNIVCGMSNLLSEQNISGQSQPTFQFLGNTDRMVSFTISTKDTRVVSSFKQMQKENSRVILENNNVEGLGFIRIQNEFIRLMGIEYMILKEVNVKTQKGFPGLYEITVRAYDYNKSQRHKESIKGFKPFDGRDGTMEDLISQDKQGIINKAKQDNYVEEKIKQIELYPDLELPTFDEIDDYIGHINSFRNNNGITPMNIKEYPREETDGIFADPDFYLFYPSISNDVKGDEGHNNMERKTYEIDVDKLGEPIEIETPIFDGDVNSGRIFDDLSNNINTMFCGIKEQKHGRMLSAFPTYMFLILDQANNWLDGQKVWTNYYVNQSLMTIDIVHERNQPIGTASVSISNMYKSLEDKSDFSKFKEDPNENDFLNKHVGWKIGLKADENIIYNKNIIRDRFKLNSGAKIHLRLGYGSNAANLPINFNGYITEIEHGDNINLLAQSDGRELTNQPFVGDENTTNSLWKLGNEPTNIIKNIFQNRQSFLTYLNPKWFEANKYGIESFGIIDKRGWLHYLFNNNNQYYNDLFSEEIDTGIVKDASELTETEINDALKSSLSGRLKTYNYASDTIDKAEEEILKKKVDNQSINNAEPTTWEKLQLNIGVGLVASGIVLNNPLQKSFGQDMVAKGQGQYVKQEFIDSYDLMMNVYLAVSKKAIPYTAVDEESFAMFDGEQNLKMYLDSLSTWDILKNIDFITPTFVCSPMYFQFESRLFFGKKQWMSRYKYVTREDALIEKARSFQQWYYINDQTNIIKNNMKVTSKNLITGAVTKWHHSDAGNKKGNILHADASINYNKQKTSIFESDFTGDILGPDFLYEGLGWSPHKKNVNSFSLSQLKESFNRMYDGEIIVRGMAAIKPHDLVYIDDDYKRMYGNIEARRVTHSFSFKNGFTTTIKPDLITASADENEDTVQLSNYLNNIGKFLKLAVTLRTLYKTNVDAQVVKSLVGKLHLGVTNFKGAKGLVVKGYKGTKSVFSNIKDGGGLRTFLKDNVFEGLKKVQDVELKAIKNFVSTRANKAKVNELANIVIKHRDELMDLKGVNELPSYYMEMDLLDDITPQLLNKLDNVDDIDEIGKATIMLAKMLVPFKNGGITVRSFTEAFKVLKAGLVISPAVVYYIVLDVILDITINSVINWISNRHTIIIDPVLKDGEPFVIGIDGAQKLIPGYRYDSTLNTFIVDDGEEEGSRYSDMSSDDMQHKKTTPDGYDERSNSRGISLDGVETTQNNTRIFASGFMWPLDYIIDDYNFSITSDFGPRIIDRNDGRGPVDDKHRGIDLDLDSSSSTQPPGGLRIVASMEGTVEISRFNSGYGHYIVLKHDNGYRTLYAHLENHDYVREEERVSKGQLIGYMGTSGSSTGVHLHFEIQNGKTPVNPEEYLPSYLFPPYKIM